MKVPTPAAAHQCAVQSTTHMHRTRMQRGVPSLICLGLPLHKTAAGEAWRTQRCARATCFATSRATTTQSPSSLLILSPSGTLSRLVCRARSTRIWSTSSRMTKCRGDGSCSSSPFFADCMHVSTAWLFVLSSVCSLDNSLELSLSERHQEDLWSRISRSGHTSQPQPYSKRASAHDHAIVEVRCTELVDHAACIAGVVQSLHAKFCSCLQGIPS